jgi:hypothetical protein
MGRVWRPSFARNSVAIEDRPNRAAAIVSVVNPGERCIQKIVGIPIEVFGIEIAALHVGIEQVVVVGDVLSPGFVIEALAQHVD